MLKGITVLPIICNLMLVATGVEAKLATPAGIPSQQGIGGINQPQIDFDEPGNIVKDGMESIRSFMQQGKDKDSATIFRFLQDKVVQQFDLDKMANWIAGPAYMQLTIQQRVAFQGRLREKMFTAISRQMGVFSNQKLRLNYFRPKRTGSFDVISAVRIMHPNQSPIRMTFKFHHTGQFGWRVYDIAINGMSALLYYRNYYQQRYAQYGPKAFLY